MQSARCRWSGAVPTTVTSVASARRISVTSWSGRHISAKASGGRWWKRPRRRRTRAGYSVVTIGVDQPNRYARRLYERWGYQWLKDTRQHWGVVHILARRLPPSVEMHW